MLGIAAGLFLGVYGGMPWWLNVLLVFVLLLVRPMQLAVSLALVVADGIRIAAAIADNVRTVPEWDFRVFWLHAQLAARGYDFYDRNLVRGFLSMMHASPRMIELGRFWNPPQAMVLLLPIGSVNNLHVAYALWYAVQVAALGGCVFLLWREYGAPVIGVLALVLALYPTLATFVVGQTHFLVLLLILAAWRARTRIDGGVWLALAVVLKPIALLLIVEPLVRKRWRAIAGFAAALVALTAASLALFGVEVHERFFSQGAGAVPRAMLTQLPNRSLLASVLRAGWPEWVFVALAIPIAAAALMVGWRDRDGRLALPAILAAALLLYPQTLDHYGILLAVAIVALWQAAPAGPVIAGVVHALAAPVPGIFDLPNLVLAAAVALTFCVVTMARARVAIITAA